MRKFLVFLVLISSFICVKGVEPFRFALFTDLHIQSANQQASDDLKLAVQDVNTQKEIDFVLVSGDITHYGDSVSLQNAKSILDKLNVPYYIINGNHELYQKQYNPTLFINIFGADKFSILHKGVFLIGYSIRKAQKPAEVVIANSDIEWVSMKLSEQVPHLPVLVVAHHPLLTGDVENWKPMTDVLKKYNVQAVLNGHYHRNAILNYDQIPGIVNRSVLRSDEGVVAYSVYSVSDSIRVFEKPIGKEEELWLEFAIENKNYNAEIPIE